MSKALNNYNKEYFNWYKEIGELGGVINTKKFEKYINYNDVVLDFGCGGGYLLKNLVCFEKHGLEINENAINEAKKNLDKVFNNIELLSLNKYDKIISNNVLQHCENPFLELKGLNKLLKKNGLIIVIVSCSSRELAYKPKDINYQLYSWSPMNLGNILDAAGFKVLSVKNYYDKWPPKPKFFYNFLGKKIFNLICLMNGLFNNKISNIVAVAKKNK